MHQQSPYFSSRITQANATTKHQVQSKGLQASPTAATRGAAQSPCGERQVNQQGLIPQEGTARQGMIPSEGGIPAGLVQTHDAVKQRLHKRFGLSMNLLPLQGILPSFLT